ncbi:hypothetical protein N7448_008957 [Penicillium atrosanguineum]|nr:hypothetical protein N7448_008957 [Penicillium atrosanguineum]
MTPQLSAALPHQSLTPSSITVTLHKGGPKDYRMLKLCRRVALLNTLGKLLKTVIVTRISWAAEKGILPKGRLGGRRGVCRSRNQLILNQVYKAWSMNRKVGILLLDVSGAYDNVSHERLLYNIKKLKLGRFMPGFSPSCKATAPDSDSWGSSNSDRLSHHHRTPNTSVSGWTSTSISQRTTKKSSRKPTVPWKPSAASLDPRGGTSLSAMRQIYRAVVIPQLFWGLAAWWSPASGNMPVAEQSRVVRGFTRIQKRAALMISGAFKSTSDAALDIELFLTPINLLMQQTIEETAIRIETGDQCQQEAKPKRKEARRDYTPRGVEVEEERPIGAVKDCTRAPPPWETRIKCVMEDGETAIQTHDTI